MGQISFNAGIAKRLYNSANRFMGHIPGGLALATVAGVTVFKTICGSGAATNATFAAVAVPEMDRLITAKTNRNRHPERLEYYFLLVVLIFRHGYRTVHRQTLSGRPGPGSNLVLFAPLSLAGAGSILPGREVPSIAGRKLAFTA
jgi:hypothetical protein